MIQKFDMLIDNGISFNSKINLKGLNIDPIFRESSKSALAKINTLLFLIDDKRGGNM